MMSNGSGLLVISLVPALLFFSLIMILVGRDNDCIKNGGTIIVVSEKQAKGTFNHTECKYDRHNK
jgi:hypothetical protein